MARILLILTALATAIALAAGCGSDGASSSDAAELAPAGSFVYGEATLRPEGEQKAAIESLVAKFPGEGSGGERITRLLEKAVTETDPEYSWKEDFEPWIGDEAAFFVSAPPKDGDEADGAILVATDDEDATVELLEKERGDKSDYRGHDLYVFSEDDSGGAVVDGWLVVGTPDGVKAAIDVAEGGDPISEDERYEKTLADADEERLGFVYVDLPAVARLAETPAGPALEQFRRLFSAPFVVTMDADEAGIRMEGVIPEGFVPIVPLVGEGSELTEGLPADSWLALGQKDLAQLVGVYFDTLGARGVFEQQFRSQFGLDLEKDVLSWMGDWSAFIRGATVRELNGAVIVETTDEAASGRFIDAIERLARKNAEPGTRIGPLAVGGGEGFTFRGPGVDQRVHLFQRDGKVVSAYGDAAARDALDPAEKLGDTATFADAEGALGNGYAVSFFFAMEPVLELAKSEGAGSDPDFREALPYLEPFGAVVGGARRDGDKLRTAFGVSVK